MKSELHAYFMEEALKEAKKAYQLGEVPVGAVIVYDNVVIARSHNMTETLQQPLEHAEIRVIQQAAGILNTRRLDNTTLYVTLEPCTMCSGAIILSRISQVVYAAKDSKSGAVDSLYSVLQDSRLNHQCEVLSGICCDESMYLLQSFFKELRNGTIPTSSSKSNER